MILYKVPFDFTHEEKVFGGYLSLRQMLYMILSAISIGILFLHIVCKYIKDINVFQMGGNCLIFLPPPPLLSLIVLNNIMGEQRLLKYNT